MADVKHLTTKKEDAAFQLFTRLTDVVELACAPDGATSPSPSPITKPLLLLSGMALLRQLAVCCEDGEENKSLFTAIDSVNKKITGWIHKPPSTTSDMTQLELALVYRHCLQEIVYEHSHRSKTTQESIFSLETLQPLLLCLNPAGKYVSYVSPNAESVLTLKKKSIDEPKRVLMKHIRAAATHYHLSWVDAKSSDVSSTTVTSPPPMEKTGIVIVQKEERPESSLLYWPDVHDYLPWVIQPKSIDLNSKSTATTSVVMERITVHLLQMLFPKKHAWNIHFSKAVISVSVGLIMSLLHGHPQSSIYIQWLRSSVSDHPIELYETFQNLFRRVACIHHLGVLERRAYLKSLMGSPLPLLAFHESEKQSIRLCVDWIGVCVREHMVILACDFMGLPTSLVSEPHTNFYRDTGLWLKTQTKNNNNNIKYKVSAFLPVMQETLLSWAPPCVYQTLQSPTLKFEWDEKKNDLLRHGDRLTRIAMYLYQILTSCECASGIVPLEKYQQQMTKRLSEFPHLFHNDRMKLIITAHRREVEQRL